MVLDRAATGRSLRTRPARARIVGMGIADDTPRLDTVERLQIGDHLFEDPEAARAVEFADMRRDHHAAAPAERDRALHVPADGQHRFGETRHGSSISSGAMPRPMRIGRGCSGDHAHDGIVGRPHDRPVVMQKAVGHLCQPRCGFGIVGDHRLAADIAGGRDQRPAEIGRAADDAAGCRAETRRARPGPAPARRSRRNPRAAAPSTIGRSGSAQARASARSRLTRASHRIEPVGARCGNMTASGLSGRCLRCPEPRARPRRWPASHIR